MNILERADKIVNHRSEEKERMYGPFSESMERAAAIYNAASPKNEQDRKSTRLNSSHTS